jgi:transposase-like protein
VAYPLSTRHVEELMEERGIHVDHSTINRWVIKYSPQLEEAFHRRRRPVWVSWRMDETYIRVKGEWRYLYRVVLSQISILRVKSETLVSEIQRVTDLKTPEKTNLRQNPR